MTADTEGWARPVSAWVRTSTAAADVGRDAAVAVQAARTAPGQIATLILPSDASWNAGGVVAEALPAPSATAPDPSAVRNAARVLREGKNVLILLGGLSLRENGQALAWRVAQAAGAKILGEMVNARVARGRGRMQLARVPYPPDQAIRTLAEFEHVVLVNAKAPVGFFAYPGKPSLHHPENAEVHVLAHHEQDGLAALQALADELDAPPTAIPDPGPRPEPGRGTATPEGLARTVAALMPEDAIVSDESVSFGRGFYTHTHAAPAHDWLHLTGGAIGDGMPVATGAAIGSGGQRRVISLQADGSAMYSLQSLWTQARERLPVTTLILANRKYQILIGEYAEVGADPGPTAMTNGMGVEAARATTLERCSDLMVQSFARSAPFVIELELPAEMPDRRPLATATAGSLP
jgi:acetolactate synthase-1/2/3 large subunit